MKFDAHDWPVISALFDQVLDLPPQQRDRWLDDLPAEQRVHRGTLERLLADHAHVQTRDFLDTLPKVGVAGDTARAGSGEAGRAVGPYRLLRELGRGGMGSVWLAERTDGLLKRQVALKLPHPGLATQSFRERLARERDILAALAHPHIARLYDAGLTPEGQPYIALAYVQGQTLIAHCDHLRLGLRERIGLFQQVLEAVQYAHTHLVVHRDLKPSNVLVDEQGQVHLLDFGIAKLVVEGRAEATELTLGAGPALTPDYASPEQIAGGAITTVSDVYSLGVLLYQLLAGRRPYALQRGSHATLEAAILATDPPRPSTVARAEAAATCRGTEAPALARALRGDLDTIVMKALQKEPAQRYASAEAMRQDLQRHLDGEPVLAQPDRALYRLRKFVGRHRLPVALAAAALIALIAGVAAVAWQAHVATRERDHALTLLSRNEAVNEFLDLLITEAAQAPRPVTVADMLERSEALAAAEFRHEPEQQALVLAMLGMQHRTVGEAGKAEALLQRAVVAAKASHDASFTARLDCQHASTVEILGRVDEARTSLLATARRDDIDPQTAAECFAYLSYLEQDVNDGPAAVDAARRALGKLKLSSLASPSLEASYLGNLAYGLHLSGHNDEASREYANAIRLYAELGREASPNAIAIRSNWAVVNDGAGDPRAALALYEENLALIAQRGQGDPPPYLLGNRARALELMGRFDAAAEAYRTARDAAERSGNPVIVNYCLLGLASIAREQGALDEAARVLLRIDAADATTRPPGGPIALAEHILRGRIALSRHRPDAAQAEFGAAIAERRPNGSTVTALTGRAEAALTQGQLEAALRDARDAVQLAQKLQGGKPHSVRTGLARLIEGRVLARQGDAAAAREAYRDASVHLADTVDPSHPALHGLPDLIAALPAH
jgi:eukaryotic-like serine/threonine-protein kinase